LGTRAVVSSRAYLGENVVLLGPVRIEDGVVVEDGCFIGKPSDSQEARLFSEQLDGLTLNAWDTAVDTITMLGKGCRIGRLSTIHAGTVLHEYAICEDYTTVGYDCEIGARSKLMYRVQVHCRVQIGEDCRIGGFCCNDSVIGHHVSLFGHLLHAYRMSRGRTCDPAPCVEDGAIIGFGAQVIGGVRIGFRSYVAAGAIVTKDVPPESIVTGVNTVCSLREWRGRLSALRLGEDDLR
jgi:acetyltransferase-like isoleucine patch superfamily enzyme